MTVTPARMFNATATHFRATAAPDAGGDESRVYRSIGTFRCRTMPGRRRGIDKHPGGILGERVASDRIMFFPSTVDLLNSDRVMIAGDMYWVDGSYDADGAGSYRVAKIGRVE